MARGQARGWSVGEGGGEGDAEEGAQKAGEPEAMLPAPVFQTSSIIRPHLLLGKHLYQKKCHPQVQEAPKEKAPNAPDLKHRKTPPFVILSGGGKAAVAEGSRAVPTVRLPADAARDPSTTRLRRSAQDDKGGGYLVVSAGVTRGRHLPFKYVDISLPPPPGGMICHNRGSRVVRAGGSRK